MKKKIYLACNFIKEKKRRSFSVNNGVNFLKSKDK